MNRTQGQPSAPSMPILSPKRALLAEIAALNRDYGVSNAIQLPGYIRSEVPLTTQSEIIFPIGVNETAGGNPIFPTENRLALSDAFYITHFGVMFSTFVTASGDAARLAATLHTFPNTVVFGANASALRGAYNGRMELRVDDRVYIDSMDLMRFYRAGTAQQGLEQTVTATTGAYFADNWLNSEMFALETDPLVRLNGYSKNLFRVTLPGSLNFAQVGTDTVVATLYLRGWLSQNGGVAKSANR